MYDRARRVINKHLAATSTVRLIDAFVPPDPEQSARIILKPKEKKKRIPGTSLLIKLAADRQKMKEKRAIEREAARAKEPEIDEAAVNDAIEDIYEALEI